MTRIHDTLHEALILAPESLGKASPTLLAARLRSSPIGPFTREHLESSLRNFTEMRRLSEDVALLYAALLMRDHKVGERAAASMIGLNRGTLRARLGNTETAARLRSVMRTLDVVGVTQDAQ